MNQTLQIPVSPNVLAALQRIAEREALPLEQLAANWLKERILEKTDPLDALIGSFQSTVPDWLENHDHHFAQAGFHGLLSA
jgi:hypothetical protein